jgi:SAM-dependent methyltransferase
VTPSADHFSSLALSYAQCRPRYPDALFAYLASLVKESAVVWDCAAGSGQATIPLAGHFSRIIATDVSASMLGQAPAHPAVEYRVGSAHSSGLPTGSVDLITVAQALHWLELDGFYAEVRRVLAPGGVLAVWTYGTPGLQEPALDKVLQYFHSHVVGPYWPEERRHVETGYRNLSFPFAELQPPEFAMEEWWTLARLLGYLRTWSATQRYLEQVGKDPVEAVQQVLTGLWGDQSVRRVRWPLSVRLGRVKP